MIFNLFPKFALAAMPAVYAWQIHGWAVAIGAFLLVCLLLVAIERVFVRHNWTWRGLICARTALVILSMIVIGISGMERCNADLSICHRVFTPSP